MSGFSHPDIVASASQNATGDLVAQGASAGIVTGRLLGVVLTGDAAAASTAVIKTGGASGTTLVTLQVSLGQDLYVHIPGAGIPYNDGLHVTLTNGDLCTAFYVDESPSLKGIGS